MIESADSMKRHNWFFSYNNVKGNRKELKILKHFWAKPGAYPDSGEPGV